MYHVKVLYGETSDDHILIYCELAFPNSIFTESINEVTAVKFNIVWEEVSNDQLESHSSILDTLSIELWPDFLSCNTISCNNALHHQRMDRRYSEQMLMWPLRF